MNTRWCIRPQMKQDDLAILIPTRNRPAILKRTLEELKARGFGGHPLVVYDDASDEPGAIEATVSTWPGARLLRGKTRCGQARGRNELMRSTSCPHAVFLDDDSWPEDYQSLMAAAAAAQKDGVAVATFQYRSLADGKLSVAPGRTRGPISGFLGGASLFHVSKVLGCGGYRESLVYGYEEPELAMRLWLRGLTVEYFPGVVIAHNHFEVPGERRNNHEYDYLYARNGILMSSMNMPLWLGLPHGLLRSLRRSVQQRRRFSAKFNGTLAGINMTFLNWMERTPSSASQAFKWIEFNRKY
jgi:GT2 family glycosyltransferase